MVASHDLWERDRQLDAGAARIAAARAGRGGALFIVGEAGLGKTSVLDELCRRAGDGVVVCRARCDPMEASLPFGLLAQMVEALGRDGRSWTQATAPGADRPAAFYRALQWLEDAPLGPVLVALDDLHWADPDSLEIVGFLCRRLERIPVAVVGSLRPWPPAAVELAWGLANHGDAAVERLEPLSEEAAAGVLAGRFAADVSADLANRAWQISAGNPLLLDLAARALTTDGPAVATDERSLVLRRFSGLPPAGARWVKAAAVLGLEFRPELVSEVAGLEGEAAEVAAEAVWRSGLTGETPHGAGEFTHPLFGQLLYEDIPPPVRASLHARAFTALAVRGMDDLAAEHAIRANLAGDARAIQVLTETGRRALRAGAPTAAATRLEAAVRLSRDGTPATLLFELSQAYQEAGRPADAKSTIGQLLEKELPLASRIAALTMLSRANISLGDLDGAATAIDSAAAHGEECPEELVLPLCRHADAVLLTVGPTAAVPIAARARKLARGRDKALEAQANAKWGMVAFWSGDPSGLAAAEAEGRRLLGAGPAALAADIRAGLSGVLLPYACTAMVAERFDDAEAAIRSGLQAADRVGAVTAVTSLATSYGSMLLRTRVGDCLPLTDRLLGLSDIVPLAEPHARAVRSHALLELGDERGSAREHALARAAAAPSLWLIHLWLDHTEALRFLRRGWFKDASAAYLELEDRHVRLGIGEPCIIPFARHAAIAHARVGRLRDAERLVDWLDERASQLPCRWPAAAAAEGKAALAVRRADAAEADKHYRTAVEHLNGASLPLEHAEVLIDYGSMLRRDGRPREARELLRTAWELAESVGATWLARRAGEELAATGGRRRAKRGPNELTPQEQRIARLAATGASDKDIASHLAVSVRTVRTHLEHIYAKVGIHSRRELITMGETLDPLIGRSG